MYQWNSFPYPITREYLGKQLEKESQQWWITCIQWNSFPYPITREYLGKQLEKDAQQSTPRTWALAVSSPSAAQHHGRTLAWLACFLPWYFVNIHGCKIVCWYGLILCIVSLLQCVGCRCFDFHMLKRTFKQL